MLLAPGTAAPEFSLLATPDQRLSLSDFRGQPLVLAFYPADFSPVCSDQMSVYSQLYDEFCGLRAQVMGVSVDGVWCHLAFRRQQQLRFPLLSDSQPKGEVARAYGAYDEQIGECLRALYVLDEQARVFWSYLSPIGVNPGADGILDALERLQHRQPEARP
jgi:peroxiredoxin